MTILPAPPARSQKDAPDADNWEFCGETDVGVVLTACGRDTSTEDVAVYLRSTYGESGVRNGTDSGELVAAVQHFGGAAHSVSGAARSIVDDALQRGHYLILAIYSDGRGNPGTRHTGHWITVFGRDDSSYSVMNSLGDATFGTNRTYSLATIEDNSQELGVEVDMSAVGGAYRTTGDEPLNLSQKRALCFPMRILTAGNWPEDQPTLDYYAARVADDGGNLEDIFGEMLADARKGGRVPLFEQRPKP